MLFLFSLWLSHLDGVMHAQHKPWSPGSAPWILRVESCSSIYRRVPYLGQVVSDHVNCVARLRELLLVTCWWQPGNVPIEMLAHRPVPDQARRGSPVNPVDRLLPEGIV